MNEENESFILSEPCDSAEEIKAGRKYISSLFLRFTLSSLLAFGITMGLSYLMMIITGIGYDSFITLAVSELYVALMILLFVIFTGKFETRKLPQLDSMTPKKFFKIICISIFLMIAGSVIGNFVADVYQKVSGHTLANSVEEIIDMYPLWMVALVTVIVAPVLEEILFRRIIIGKLARYGTEFAVVVSGVLFGVFHYNVFQIFYGMFLGIMLGYVYVIFGRLSYTVILHMLINFMGSVVAILMQDFSFSESLTLNMISVLYTLLYVAAMIAGMIYVWKFMKVRSLYRVDGELVKPSKIVCANIGFWVLALFSVLMFLFSMI